MTSAKQCLFSLVGSVCLSLLPSQTLLNIGSASVPISDSVKNVGVASDCYLIMKTHISS